MSEKILCRYCGEKFLPRKIKKHEQECKNDQKGGVATGKKKGLNRIGILLKCQKCGAQTEVFVLDGAKCRACGEGF